MQTIQLLGGPAGRAPIPARAAAHLAPGGRVALAITEHFELYDAPRRRIVPAFCRRPRARGRLYRSQPTAVREEGSVFVLERRREIIGRGRPRAEDDQIRLDRLTAASLERESVDAGLRPAPG